MYYRQKMFPIDNALEYSAEKLEAESLNPRLKKSKGTEIPKCEYLADGIDLALKEICYINMCILSLINNIY